MSVDDGLDHLVADHDEVKGFFSQLFEVGVAKEKLLNQRRVLNSLIREVSRHAAVEEQHLYPMMRKAMKDEGNALVDRSLMQHQEIKEILDRVDSFATQLSSLSDDTSKWPVFPMEDLRLLQQKLDLHVLEEETDF